MSKLGAGFAYFEKTPASGWSIVDGLIKSEDVSLLLQDELVVLRRSLHETYAARQLYGDLIARHKEKLKALERSPSGSNSTKESDKIQAEVERLQRLRRNRPSVTSREPQVRNI